MQAILRLGTVPLLCGVLVLGLSACGDTHHGKGTTARTPADRATAGTTPGGLPAGVVARVGSNFIAKQTLEHWIGVQAVIQYQPGPTRPVPRGLVPKPPGYRDCIAYLAAIAMAKQTGPVPDAAQLKDQCEQEHEALLQQMLEMLITHYWVKEEAAKAGVAVTTREIRQALRRRFPTEAKLHRYLAFTRQHASDERLMLEDKLLLVRWQHASLPVYARLRRSKRPESAQMATEVDSELQELSDDMTESWTPRTLCRARYVVTLCSEYQR